MIETKVSFPNAKANQIGYPYLSVSNGEDYQSVYTGRDVNLFFEKYDPQYYLDYRISVWYGIGTWAEIGKVSDYVNLDYKFPKIKVELVIE